MKTLKLCLSLLTLLGIVTLVACSGTARQSPDVSDSIRKSLDQAGLKDVSVNQDRDKGVVTRSAISHQIYTSSRLKGLTSIAITPAVSPVESYRLHKSIKSGNF